MAVNVLVNGLLEMDSGKTWVTIGFYNALRRLGYSVGVYKPISGHNGWRQFNTVLESIKSRTLLCEDVIKYFKYTDIKYSPHLINPVDFLLVPADINNFEDIYEYMSSLEDQYRQAILVRVSNYLGNRVDYYLIRENYRGIMPQIKPWIDKLIESLNPDEVDKKQLFDIVASDYLDKVLNRSLEKLSEENDYVFIESFNNASTPYKKAVDDVDILLTVTPGYIIRPRTDEALTLLKNSLEKYMVSSDLLNRSGIELIAELPPAKDPSQLSQYLTGNWSKYKELISI